jgi:hypothetical protein
MFPGQMPAYDDCLAQHGAEARWIAFFDIDEFLFSPGGERVADLLREYEQWPGVVVNVAKFGPSGHRTKPPGLVTESYVMRVDTVASRHASRQVKSIVDPAAVDRSATAHAFVYRRLLPVDENGYPVAAHLTKSPSFERLRINHYYSRSEEELRAKQTRRTADYAWERPPVPEWETLREAESKVSVPDDAILRFVPALHEALGRRRSG